METKEHAVVVMDSDAQYVAAATRMALVATCRLSLLVGACVQMEQLNVQVPASTRAALRQARRETVQALEALQSAVSGQDSALLSALEAAQSAALTAASAESAVASPR